MDGIGSAATMYGKYIEKYLHKEELVEVPPPEDFEEEDTSCTYYDVRSPLSVFLLQVGYFALIPFIAIKELYLIMKDVYNRDVHKMFNTKYL